MIILTVGSCFAVLIASIVLYVREIDEAKYNQISVATTVVENEIDDMLRKAEVAAIGMANNPDLIESLINDDLESIIRMANALKGMAQLDFCNIIDNKGYVITRTHAPEIFGDNISNQPHVALALQGEISSNITQGAVILLGTYAGAPVYDHDNNLIGAISLGFRLDIQQFSYRMKELVGCEVSVYLRNERISTTLVGIDNTYVLGDYAPENISDIVLGGEIYIDTMQIFGHELLAKIFPLKGADGNPMGMVFIGFYTTDSDLKIVYFILLGALITLGILCVSLFIAMGISKIVEQRLSSAYEINTLQLVKIDLMVDSAQIGLWDLNIIKDDPFNPDNSMVFSDIFRHLLGYDNATDFPDILGSWSKLLHPDDIESTLTALRNHLFDASGKTPYNIEHKLMKKNGKYAHFRSVGETIRDKDGYPLRVCGSLTDITEQKENLAVIEKARTDAESSNQAKSAFLANMSHEIRTPMNSIIGFSELALDNNVTPKVKQYLINITDNAKWLLNIINDILDSAKIESGKIELEHIPFDLHDVISQCQSAILPKAAEKGLILYCYSEPLGERKLLGDPIRLRQVFMNLLTNAVKFTEKGTIKLLAGVISTSDETAKIKFEVKDNGIGMTNEQISNIFEPFMQADHSITRKFGGTGLGLSITKNIIDIMGGKLSVISTLDVGSTFSFELTFDMIDADLSALTESTILRDIERPTFIGEVLVCEDNTLNQQVVCEHLERVGLKVFVANDGKEAVDIIMERLSDLGDGAEKKTFDLIFMDIHMPVMDGLEAATIINQLGVETPVIALTANVMSNDLEIYKTNGMQGYLGKPFTSQELWRCLIKYLPVVKYTSIDEQTQSQEEAKAHKQLCIHFVRSNQETYTNLMNAVNSSDITKAHRIAHTLKGNAGQIGEKALKEISATVELMLANGENKLDDDAPIFLEAELKAVLQKLAPLLEEAESSVIHEINDKDEALKILDMLEALLNKNSPECMNMIDNIKSIKGADDLARYVSDFEVKKALEELSRLKGSL